MCLCLSYHLKKDRKRKRNQTKKNMQCIFFMPYANTWALTPKRENDVYGRRSFFLPTWNSSVIVWIWSGGREHSYVVPSHSIHSYLTHGVIGKLFFHTHTQRNYVAFEYFKTQRSLPEFIFFFNLLKARSHIFTTDLRLDLVYSFTFSFIFFVLKSDPSYVDEHTHIISVRSTKKYFIFDFCLNSINKKDTRYYFVC